MDGVNNFFSQMSNMLGNIDNFTPWGGMKVKTFCLHSGYAQTFDGEVNEWLSDASKMIMSMQVANDADQAYLIFFYKDVETKKKPVLPKKEENWEPILN